MLGELAVILIMLITVGFIYLKGSAIKSFLLLINTFIALITAFAYFETLGRLIIGYDIMVKWAFAASLILIFALTLAILNAISSKLLSADIYFGDLPDRIAKCLIAAFAGFAIAGVVLTAAAMMPINAKLPYERFSTTPGRSTEPQKNLILSADDFVTGFASWVSRGSMSGQKSLAVFHPDLLNEIYLNRIGCDEKNSALAGSESAVSVDTALAPQTPLVSAADNQPISESSRTKAVIIKAAAEGLFTMSQIRLVCKAGDSAGNLQGSGQVVWPIGYISRDNVVDLKDLSEKITMNQLDLVFYIPADTVPVMLQFKQNAVAQVGKLESGETTPPPQTPVEQAPAQQTPAEQNSTQK
ncbi:MAG: hypothetical protein NTW93_05850 [Phycisphaerae bacterium]|nr:hypothetical protein [Phycisphaerae bacterium]